MPLYVYQCKECETTKEQFASVNHRHEAAPDCGCGQKMVLKVIPPMVAPIIGGHDFPGYECPVTGEYVTSRKRRREIMAEHDLVEKE